MDYLLALDQGTTGSTALLVDTNLQRVSEASLDFEQIYPEPGWVEHDPKQIWASVVSVIKQVTSKIDPKKIVAIGITNQRETICFLSDRKSGEPLANAIVWQDRRTAKRCEELRSRSLEPVFQEATGLLLDPYFSGTKVRWALENWGAVQTAQKQGTLAVGTVDSYLCARLTWGQAHVTEPSNASRTLAFHLTERRFDQRLCEELQVPLEIWPSVLPSAGEFGRTLGVPGLPDGIQSRAFLGISKQLSWAKPAFEREWRSVRLGPALFC